MLQTLLKGFILGLTLAVLIGPAFFTLVQTSIHRGFKSGMFLAIGIFISDLTLVFLSYLGASQILNAPQNQKIVGISGGLMLIVFGIYTFRHKMHITETGGIEVKKPGNFTYILKGFFLNLANPSVWIYWVFWVGVITAQLSTEEGIAIEKVFAFFAATLLTVFATDLLKCFIAFRIKIYLNDKVLKLINHIVGILLVIFGLYLLYHALIHK
jgi:threonine/homoserine/homoserine lactone efflux protein